MKRRRRVICCVCKTLDCTVHDPMMGDLLHLFAEERRVERMRIVIDGGMVEGTHAAVSRATKRYWKECERLMKAKRSFLVRWVNYLTGPGVE